MKQSLLSFFTLLAIASLAQQNVPNLKRDHIFLTTELSKTLGASSFDKKYGFSVVYNRMLPNTRFGIGAGLEIIDIRTQGLGGIMPVLDIRYYAQRGKSTFIPLAQAGYNFYRFQYAEPGTAGYYEEKGGFGYSFGLGYSYNLTERGGGLYGALKFRGLQYRYNDPSLLRKNTSERINISIGWRF